MSLEAGDDLDQRRAADPLVFRGGVLGPDRHAADQHKLVWCAEPALIDGAVGLVVAPEGRLMLAVTMTIEGGKIVGYELVADPARLQTLDLAVLGTRESGAAVARRRRTDGPI